MELHGNTEKNPWCPRDIKHTGIAKALENLNNTIKILQKYIYRTTHLTVRDYISHET